MTRGQEIVLNWIRLWEYTGCDYLLGFNQEYARELEDEGLVVRLLDGDQTAWIATEYRESSCGRLVPGSRWP